MDLQTNPFTSLTFIVAPAVLTNASAVLALSTSNRFARAIDRARELATRIENNPDLGKTKTQRLGRELTLSETRALLLLRALRSFYLSMASFALVALVSLSGSTLLSITPAVVDRCFSVLAIGVGAVAVFGLVYGSILLLRETRMVVNIIQERIAHIRKKDWSKDI